MKTLRYLAETTGITRTKKDAAWNPPFVAGMLAFVAAAAMTSLFLVYLAGALLYWGLCWGFRNSERKSKVIVRLPSDPIVPGFWRTREGGACVVGSLCVLELVAWVLP